MTAAGACSQAVEVEGENGGRGDGSIDSVVGRIRGWVRWVKKEAAGEERGGG